MASTPDCSEHDGDSEKACSEGSIGFRGEGKYEFLAGCSENNGFLGRYRPRNRQSLTRPAPEGLAALARLPSPHGGTRKPADAGSPRPGRRSPSDGLWNPRTIAHRPDARPRPKHLQRLRARPVSSECRPAACTLVSTWNAQTSQFFSQPPPISQPHPRAVRGLGTAALFPCSIHAAVFQYAPKYLDQCHADSIVLVQNLLIFAVVNHQTKNPLLGFFGSHFTRMKLFWTTGRTDRPRFREVRKKMFPVM